MCLFLASLDNTTAWLQAAASEEASAVSARSPSPDSIGPVSTSAILNRAYIRLLHWDPQDHRYPEVSCSRQNYLTLHSYCHLRDNLLIIRESLVSLHFPPHLAALQSMSEHMKAHVASWSSSPNQTSLISPVMCQMCSFELMLTT